MPAIRKEEYAAVVERERPLIQATAYLLTGDSAEAERVAQLVFAELYERRGECRILDSKPSGPPCTRRAHPSTCPGRTGSASS